MSESCCKRKKSSFSCPAGPKTTSIPWYNASYPPKPCDPCPPCNPRPICPPCQIPCRVTYACKLPERPKSFKPKHKYRPPVSKFEDSTVYKKSFMGTPDCTRKPFIPSDNLCVGTGVITKDTVHNLSFRPHCEFPDCFIIPYDQALRPIKKCRSRSPSPEKTFFYNIQCNQYNQGIPWENTFLSIGQPLLDIIVEADEEFLNKYNLLPNDAISAADGYKELFKDLIKFNPQYQAGGSVTNTARVFQWITPFPKTSCHIGAIAKDINVQILREALLNENVNFICEEVKHGSTGKCAVLLTGHNRSLVTEFGASSKLSVDFLQKKEIWDIVNKAKYYYISGYFFNVSRAIVRGIAKLALDDEKKFIFNIGAPYLCQKFKDELKDLFPKIDILFGNEEEVKSLARTLNRSSSDLKELIVQVNMYPRQSPRERLTVITRGPNPVILAHGDQVKEYPVPPMDPSKIKDTSCAGDAFVGGFLAKYVEERSFDDCVNMGVTASQEIIQHIGCSSDVQKVFS